MLKLYTKLYVALQGLKDERGQDMIEYAIVAGLITSGTVTAITALAVQITAVWTALTGFLSGAVG